MTSTQMKIKFESSSSDKLAANEEPDKEASYWTVYFTLLA